MRDSGSDIAKSLVSGSLRFLLPSLGFLYLYRVVLQAWGPAVFGLWSLFAASQSYATLADIGLSQTLIREGGADLDEPSRSRLQRDRDSAGWFYIILGLTLVLAICAGWSFVPARRLSPVYSHQGILVALVLTALGICAKQYARLDSALAAAFGRNAASLSLQAGGQLLFIVIALAMSKSAPIEGLGIGLVVSGAAEIILAKRLALTAGYRRAASPTSVRQLAKALADLVRRSRYLYLSSLGGAVREPLFRFAIASFFGLTAAGFFDVALRVTKTARESGVFGLNATFPSFARYFRIGDFAELRATIKWTLSLSLVLGALPLSGAVAISPVLYSHWLGVGDTRLLWTTILLACWYWLTLTNVPFWYAALACKMDRQAATAVWVHAASAAALVPLLGLHLIGYTGAFLFWILGSAGTQVCIVLMVRRSLSLGKIFDRNMIFQCGVSALNLISASVLARRLITDGRLHIDSYAMLYAISVAVLIWSTRTELRTLCSLFMQNRSRPPSP